MMPSDHRKSPGTDSDTTPGTPIDVASHDRLTRALELARAGQWDDAHRLVQNNADPLSCAIHGYLHRVEGDVSNAHYWYRRAGREPATISLDDEWQALVREAGSSAE